MTAVSPRAAGLDAIGASSAQPSSLKSGVLTHRTNWLANSVTWSTRNPSRFATTSFIAEYNNYVSVLQLVGAGSPNPMAPEGPPVAAPSLSCLGTFDHYYPPTKAMFSPAQYITEGLEGGDLLITSGDYLRVWHVSDLPPPPPESNTIGANAEEGAAAAAPAAAPGTVPAAADASPARPRSLIAAKDVHTLKQPTKVGGQPGATQSTTTSFCAPLTGFDWNLENPAVVATSSIDTTVSIWDLERKSVTIQIQAHDKEVFDVAFAEGRNIFASAGADGSVRVFDLRVLENCTIVFESPDSSSMLRVVWNKLDPTYMACITENATSVSILDLRFPFVPVATLQHLHTEPINAIAWAPHSSSHLVSAGEDCKTLIWEVNNPSTHSHPVVAQPAGGAQPQHITLEVNDHPMTYAASAPVNGVAWKPPTLMSSGGGTSAAATSDGAAAVAEESYVAITCGQSVQLLSV